MPEYVWFRKNDKTLCLSGFDIQIKLQPATSLFRFRVYVDGQPQLASATLALAKHDAERAASELAEFRG